MEPRACALCSEPFSQMARSFSRHPGLCPSCSSLLDGLGNGENEAGAAIWEDTHTTTSIAPNCTVREQPEEQRASGTLGRAGRRNRASVNANPYWHNEHTAEVIVVALATEEALMNELRPWLKWLESRGIHSCSVEVPLDTPTVLDSEVDSSPSPGPAAKDSDRKSTENSSEIELGLFRTGPYSDWGINE